MSNDYAGLQEFILKGKSKVYRTIENNTIVRIENEHITVKFHDSDICEIYQDNTVILFSCGYKTVTTKDRLNKFIPSPFRVYQETGLWFVWNYKTQEKYPFNEGITINPDNTVTNYGKDIKSQTKLRDRIKKYAHGYIESLLKGKVEKPNLGDCFYCQMREVKTNIPLGEIIDNTEHLKSHMSEKYYMGSLLYRAIELYPVSIIVSSCLYELWENNTLPDNWLKGIMEEQLYKSLVKYLYSEFNLPY